MKIARHLYEIADDLEAIGAQLIESGGELTPEIEAQLDSLEGEFATKAERIALFSRELERLAEGAAREAELFGKLAKGRAAASARLSAYLLVTMQKLGQQKVETDRVRIRRQKNGQPRVILPDNRAPLCDCGIARPKPVEYEIDRTKLLATWKTDEGRAQLADAGVAVEYGEHLRIE